MYQIHEQKNVLLGGVKVAFFCFKQLPLNTKEIFESPYHLIDGKRLLSVAVKVVSFLADKPLDFHNKTFSVSPSLLKSIKVFEKLSCAPSLKK